VPLNWEDRQNFLKLNFADFGNRSIRYVTFHNPGASIIQRKQKEIAGRTHIVKFAHVHIEQWSALSF
jgi:hypothetical protein